MKVTKDLRCPAQLRVNSAGSKKEDVNFYLTFSSKKFIDQEKKNWTMKPHYIEFYQKPIFTKLIDPVIPKPHPVYIQLMIDSVNEGENIILKLTTQKHYDLLYSALKELVGKIPVKHERKNKLEVA